MTDQVTEIGLSDFGIPKNVIKARYKIILLFQFLPSLAHFFVNLKNLG